MEKKMKKGFLCLCFCLAAVGMALSGRNASAQEQAEYRQIADIAYYDALTPSDANRVGDAEYRAEHCRLDLYLPPEGAEPFPTVVWYHSGGLTGGKKYLPFELKNRGIGVVMVNYRLSSPRAKCPDYLVDAAAAAAWTLDHIAEYGGDPARVYVSGHSAGGYLAAMLALDPRWMELFGRANVDLAGSFPVSGQMTTHFQILNERYGRNQAPSNPAEIDPFAPLHYTTAAAPPIYLLVGDAALEWPGRVEENALLAAMLKIPKDHGIVEYRSFPGTDHGSVVHPAVSAMAEIITHGDF